MLYVVIKQIAEQINLTLTPGVVLLADVAKHERPADTPGADELENHVLLTLINIEEENLLKNNYPVEQLGAARVTRPPALFLNLYLLFSANFVKYDEALKHIGYIIRFFQASKPFLIDDPDAGQRYKVTLTLHHIGFENLNNLWTVLGGKYLPSVLYKARLVMVQDGTPTGSQAIIDIQATEHLN